MKRINYTITIKDSEIKSINKNQIDMDILNNSKENAKLFRREIQLNNEEVYKIKLYITIYASNIQELFDKVKKIENDLYINDLIFKRANFRQLETYLESLPTYIKDNKENKIESSSEIMLTKAVISLFPFITKRLWDKKGIFIGINSSNNTMALLDIFNVKYINSNMTILGSSGAGKSFFLKLYIIRNSIKDIFQCILDLDGEYTELVNKLNGIVINFNDKNTINIFDIYINKLDNNFLQQKVEEVIYMLKNILQDITSEDEATLTSHIMKVYDEKNINNDKNSLKEYSRNTISSCYKTNYDMPRLRDLYNSLKNSNIKREVKLAKRIKDEVLNKYCFLDAYTNDIVWNTLNFNDKNTTLISFDLSLINKEQINNVIYIIKRQIDRVLDIIDNNKIIYFDEVWKLINNYTDNNMAEYIFSLFKTVRKKKASVIIATQDITDFFAFEKGAYGKTILNNSCLKMYFKTEYLEADFLINNNILSLEDISDIKKLYKGKCILKINNNNIPLSIIATKTERKLMGEELESEKDINSNR